MLLGVPRPVARGLDRVLIGRGVDGIRNPCVPERLDVAATIMSTCWSFLARNEQRRGRGGGRRPGARICAQSRAERQNLRIIIVLSVVDPSRADWSNSEHANLRRSKEMFGVTDVAARPCFRKTCYRTCRCRSRCRPWYRLCLVVSGRPPARSTLDSMHRSYRCTVVEKQVRVSRRSRGREVGAREGKLTFS